MYYESITSYTLSAIVLLIGGGVCFLVGRRLGISPALTLVLYAWHTALCLAFYSYVLSNGGDPLAYYQRAKYEYISLTYGTEFIVVLTSIPVEFGFSFLATNLLYNTIGSIGLIFFHACLRDASASVVNNTFSKALVLLCTFLPSVSFWTSGIGKDAIAFLAVALLCWSAVRLERRFVLMIAAILLMLTVRPHMAALMIVAIMVGTLFIRQLHRSLRMTFGSMALVAASVAVPFALWYAGGQNFTDFGSYVIERETSFQRTGSSIDISGMNPILRVPSFMFRPLPQEASGSAQIASSFENLILILITAFALIATLRAGVLAVFGQYAIHIIYGVAGLVILAQVIPNLGLAARQKWMMLPPLLILTVGASTIAREREAAFKRRFAPPVGAFREAQ